MSFASVTPLGIEIFTRSDTVSAFGAGVIAAGFQLKPPVESVTSIRALSPEPEGNVAAREPKAKPKDAMEAIAANLHRRMGESVMAENTGPSHDNEDMRDRASEYFIV